jgi:hypothetical protein
MSIEDLSLVPILTYVTAGRARQLYIIKHLGSYLNIHFITVLLSLEILASGVCNFSGCFEDINQNLYISELILK